MSRIDGIFNENFAYIKHVSYTEGETQGEVQQQNAYFMSARTKRLVGAACLSECISVACDDGRRNITLKPHSLKLTF